jgi:hypothetical protein
MATSQRSRNGMAGKPWGAVEPEITRAAYCLTIPGHKGPDERIVNSTPVPGHPDPFAPGLVVLLSTTPQAVGGPDANLAGLFQLTDVARSHGLAQVFADWEVGQPGVFGTGNRVTLTAYLVRGTAPSIVTGSERPISNVVKETFMIGS